VGAEDPVGSLHPRALTGGTEVPTEATMRLQVLATVTTQKAFPLCRPCEAQQGCATNLASGWKGRDCFAGRAEQNQHCPHKLCTINTKVAKCLKNRAELSLKAYPLWRRRYSSVSVRLHTFWILFTMILLGPQFHQTFHDKLDSKLKDTLFSSLHPTECHSLIAVFVHGIPLV
jgi:hypothetical protein